ncbi:SIR2 family protein [Bradyrhizobium sp. RT3a]|uniref:SIR2 family NAD-dependent protein deacylase n=1 Tax=Bradyrhizobium sp. RT3a TaxID=3156333 RepID=UPI00339B3083
MVELNYNIANLPDFPALQQLGRALWRNGSVRGASILVGAGLSKNAERPGSDTLEPPLWGELMEEMVERLYPHDKKKAPKDPLRIAEEFRTYFGQAGLDDFLRTRFPDKSWSPGPLHGALLGLPWSDVLTTNWDTLLERAENATDCSYDVVRTEADLTHARSPRIVKLHGTIGDPGPLIFAEEDYRTYPVKHAAFVNLARQVFIENELCLIGFSGDDPNFLQWAGWVRDHLGGSARRIYLAGNLRLERATRKYLEAHNIAPIDFAPLVEKLAPNRQHETAAQIFIDELRKAKPDPRHVWKLTTHNEFPLAKAGIDAHQRVHKDHEFVADLLKKAIPLFKMDRENYPGWLICPAHLRQSIAYAGDAHWLVRKAVLDLLEPKLRGEALFEILWRRTVAFVPLDIKLADALSEFVDNTPADIDPDLRLEFALALMRDARVSRDDDGVKRWGAIIEATASPDSTIRLAANYQRGQHARDRMDLPSVGIELAKITSEEAIWKLRRAALHSEIGEYTKAARLIKEACADLEQRHGLDRNSLSVKSQLAWASWLSEACDAWTFVGRADRPRPRDFKELDIDPHGELECIKSSGNKIETDRREEAVAVRPSFDAGHYSEGNKTIHVGSGDPGLILMYEFDQLTEIVGIPIHINHVNVCAWAAIPAIEAAYQPNMEWYVWLLRALHSHSDKRFERHFGRLAIAQMPATTALALISTIETAIAFWTQRFKDARSPDLRSDWSCAHDALRLMLMTLSRLTVRMSSEQAVIRPAILTP